MKRGLFLLLALVVMVATSSFAQPDDTNYQDVDMLVANTIYSTQGFALSVDIDNSESTHHCIVRGCSPAESGTADVIRIDVTRSYQGQSNTYTIFNSFTADEYAPADVPLWRYTGLQTQTSYIYGQVGMLLTFKLFVNGGLYGTEYRYIQSSGGGGW